MSWPVGMAASALLGTLLVATLTPALAAPEGCRSTIVSRTSAPDGMRSAVVVDWACGIGGYSPDVTAEVRVGSTTILGVDTGGHAEERPRIAWSNSTVLTVTVPNLSFLRIATLQASGIHVKLRFDPDDPAERAAWLAANHLPPDPPLSSSGSSP